MNDRVEVLMNEILQLKMQYASEVGSRRRAWPRSIKDRIYEVENLGVPFKNIAKSTGIPYQTILSWRYHERHNDKFHALTVRPKSIARAESASTVTVEADSALQNPARQNIVAILSDGTKIESSEANQIVEILRGLKIGGR